MHHFLFALEATVKHSFCSAYHIHNVRNRDKLPDVLKEDGYPDVQAFMATYRKAEAVVEQYNRDLAAWERQVREKQKPAQKEQAKPPERESVLKRLRQLQAEGKQRKQPRQRKKSFDRDSR